MTKILPITRLGNPVLREVATKLTVAEILSEEVQTLINDIRHTLKEKEYGVGLAAPQVGQSVALSVIGIKPTPNRPNLTPFESVIINPEIIETFGRRSKMWEGCVSCGSGDDVLYGLVPRYKKIKLRWIDETGTTREEILESFVAHVAQHETDHLNGILFIDKVKDSKSYMMADEFKQRIVKNSN